MKPFATAARGYDLYGNIAVVDAVPGAAQAIASRLMRENRNIETVLRKGGAVKGRYRTRRFIYVSGKKNHIATYRENGCVFRFDVRKTFFSTRLAYERKRVNELVRNGERIVVMFAGVGPYSIEIAKSHKRCRVVSIELNAAASGYAEENARLNKTANVVVERGNVDRFAKKYAGFADRVLMPLPKDAARFLPTALRMCAKRCTIHYYSFCKMGEIKSEIDGLRAFFVSRGRRFVLLNHRVVRPYSAKDVEIVVDFLVY